MSKQEDKPKGRGGPGRGQGRKPNAVPTKRISVQAPIAEWITVNQDKIYEVSGIEKPSSSSKLIQ